ncbi:large-conductance mechanosensitive channel [Powellomyces hirtus]|nr:large-conductance mechanosensitive channel [Powellomyces hirtus]
MPSTSSQRRIAPIPPENSHLVDLAHTLKNETVNGTLKTTKAVHSVFHDFKIFLNRGNVIDLATGIVMGTAFTAIVQSLVNDIFLPVVSLSSPTSQLSSQYILLRCPRDPRGPTKPCNKTMYITPAAARTAGAITWNWGQFVQEVVNFIIISFIVFFIIKMYTRAFRRNEPAGPVDKKDCPLCTKAIPIKAIRCPECCADLPNEPEKNEKPMTEDDDSGNQDVEVLEMTDTGPKR